MDTGQSGLNEFELLEAQVYQSRSDLTAKLDEVKRRMQPEHFLEKGINNMNNYISEGSSRIAQVIRDNPIPSALAGVALAWLAARAASDYGASRSKPALPENLREQGKKVLQEVQRRVSSYASTAGEQAGSTARDLGETANRLSHQVAEQAESLGTQMSGTIRKAQKRVTGMYEENPVAFSAVTLLAGALLAFLPARHMGARSVREDEERQYH